MVETWTKTDDQNTAKALYDRLATVRLPYLDRGRDAAKLTIPAELKPEGHTGASELHVPWQGLGSQGVNSLASKVTLTIMPPNTPFQRHTIDPYTRNIPVSYTHLTLPTLYSV